MKERSMKECSMGELPENKLPENKLPENKLSVNKLPVNEFPVDGILGKLSKALELHKAAILKAEPGAGKTTRVPPFLMEADWLHGQKILMLEPRRLAVRHAAEFMSQQHGGGVGETFGYSMRLDKCCGPNTKVEVITEGILIHRLLQDPELNGVGLVIFDEFHERSLNSDLGLGMCLDVMEHFRDDLRVLLMSATMDEAPFLKLMPEARVLYSSGRQFPLEVHYEKGPEDRPDLAQVQAAVKSIFAKTDGDVLVFLPGAGEVMSLVESLKLSYEQAQNERGSEKGVNDKRLTKDDAREMLPEILPLFGQLDFAEQRRATRARLQGQRAIVVSTDIAETSLTIPNVKAVVDAGFAREPQWDEQTGLCPLKLKRISRDSADQRAGRAGRVAAGQVIRLWSEARHKGLLPARRPEIERSPLETAALQVMSWGSDRESFPWVSFPSRGQWLKALERLRHFGALSDQGVTPLGQELLHFPMEPLLARIMLTGKKMNCGALASLLVTWWQSRDPFLDGHEDLETRLMGFYAQLKAPKYKSLAREFRDLCSKVDSSPKEFSKDMNTEVLGKLILEACPEKVALKRGLGNDHLGKENRSAEKSQQGRYVFSEGGGFCVSEGSRSLRRLDYIFAPCLSQRGRGEPMAKVGFGWSSESFLEQVKEQLSDGVVVAYDENSKKVISRRQISWKGLVLESHPHQASQEEKQHCFWEVVQQLDGFDELPLSPDAFSWWKRYVCYLHWEESLPLEALEGVKASIFSNMKAWLLPYLAGIFSWEAFEKLDWFHAIQGAVQPEIHRCMDQKYPGKLKVPSGSELPLDYGDPMEPILAVRIQEVFGLLKTPVIAGGKVKLLLHLLSPARRPVQITTDLESFWDKGYFEVKKELKRRYPKHDWPDNPLQAQPKRGIKRRAD